MANDNFKYRWRAEHRWYNKPCKPNRRTLKRLLNERNWRRWNDWRIEGNRRLAGNRWNNYRWRHWRIKRDRRKLCGVLTPMQLNHLQANFELPQHAELRPRHEM
jgi:hypothetical protein